MYQLTIGTVCTEPYPHTDIWYSGTYRYTGMYIAHTDPLSYWYVLPIPAIGQILVVSINGIISVLWSLYMLRGKNGVNVVLVWLIG